MAQPSRMDVTRLRACEGPLPSGLKVSQSPSQKSSRWYSAPAHFEGAAAVVGRLRQSREATSSQRAMRGSKAGLGIRRHRLHEVPGLYRLFSDPAAPGGGRDGAEVRKPMICKPPCLAA